MKKQALALATALTVFGLAPTHALAAPPPKFPAGAVWHQNISQAPRHPNSSSMIGTLAGLGGFGYGRMQIDFGMHIVRAPANAPLRSLVGYPSNSEYYAPDCEAIGSKVPVPLDAAIEGTSGLTCSNADNDCHYLVVQGSKLYEAYRANTSGASNLQAQCLAVWNLDAVYPEDNRGDHCTSADAAGFPIAPLLFNADEVYSAMQVAGGDLGHAIRFILPNSRMASIGGRTRLYVRPASHAGAPSGPESSVPYGSRLRLRADFPVNLYPPAAQVILRTMQRYGIVLADGGNIALTAESDLFTTHSWAELGITSRVFDRQVAGAPVRIQDFDVLDTGPRIVETYDCVRNPEPPSGGLPTISIADASVGEGNAGTKILNFTANTSAASVTPVRFSYTTADGSALSGVDYISTASSAEILPGATSTTIAVPIVGDLTPEPTESFNVTLNDIVGAAAGDTQAVGTITNDDYAKPLLSIADAQISEGNSGTKLANFMVRLSSPAPSDVTYTLTTGDQTASAGSDYRARSVSGLLIPAGSSSRNFSVTVYGDTSLEANETLTVSVTNANGASVSDGHAVGTIVNDD